VQFTRNPDGLAGALKKIGGAGSRLTNPHAQEASHLFFATGLRSSFIGLLSTHPPLTERIQRIDPTFAGEFPKLSPEEASMGVPRGGTLEGALAVGLAGDSPTESPGAQALAHATDGAAVRGEALLASIGAPQPEHVAYAAHLLRSLPRPVLDAAHDPDGAVALLLALLLHDHGPAASAQRHAVEAYGGGELRTRVEALSRAIAPIGPAARLPLLDLLLPAARGGDLSPDQALGLHDTAQAMIEADGRMDAFELALLHVVGRQLTAVEHGRQDGDGSGAHSLGSLHDEVETVLSAIAWSGAPDEETAVPAFSAAAASLDSQGNRATLRPRGSVTIEQVDEALARLRAAAAPVRRRVLNACMQAVAHDGLVDVDEAELLRAVAEALDCPMPPLVGTMTL
jgi:hypothetical protein